MTEQKKEQNTLKNPVQKRYQEELSRYQKQIEKTKKILVRRGKAE